MPKNLPFNLEKDKKFDRREKKHQDQLDGKPTRSSVLEMARIIKEADPEMEGAFGGKAVREHFANEERTKQKEDELMGSKKKAKNLAV